MKGCKITEYKNGNLLFQAKPGLVKDYSDLYELVSGTPGNLSIYVDDNDTVWIVNPYAAVSYFVGTKTDFELGFCDLLSNLKYGISYRLRPYKGIGAPHLKV